jgi:hypothetical protein
LRIDVIRCSARSSKDLAIGLALACKREYTAFHI